MFKLDHIEFEHPVQVAEFSNWVYEIRIQIEKKINSQEKLEYSICQEWTCQNEIWMN